MAPSSHNYSLLESPVTPAMRAANKSRSTSRTKVLCLGATVALLVLIALNLSPTSLSSSGLSADRGAIRDTLCASNKHQSAEIPTTVETEEDVTEIENENEKHGAMPLEPTFEELKANVADTNGYYARDWDLGLEWNDLRHMIEASFMQARLMGRTLIVPSFVYARTCEFDSSVCSSFATPHPPKVKAHPHNKNKHGKSHPTWLLPINLFLDLQSLRRLGPVVTTSEYLALNGFPSSVETPHSGKWNREAYHRYHDVEKNAKLDVSLSVIPNKEFDENGQIVRVDKFDSQLGTMVKQARNGELEHDRTDGVQQVLLEARERHNGKGKGTLDLRIATEAIKEAGLQTYKDGDKWTQQSFLRNHGWVVLYTFEGEKNGDEKARAVVRLMELTVPVIELRSWWDEYEDSKGKVVLMEGATHAGRKPGQLLFTSPESREWYANMATWAIAPVPPIARIARDVAQRMADLNQGRMWLSAYIPAGDLHQSDVDNDLQHFRHHVQEARSLLAGLRARSVQDQAHSVLMQPELSLAELPREGDKFFLSSTEKDPAIRNALRAHGAMDLSDLLTAADRRFLTIPGPEHHHHHHHTSSSHHQHKRHGDHGSAAVPSRRRVHEERYPITIYGELNRIIEQAVVGHAAWLWASRSDATAGGMLNSRNAEGWGPEWAHVHGWTDKGGSMSM